MRKILIQLGAGEKEVSLFLVLLELGAQPVSTLAKRIGLPRSSTYLLLENLEKIGLVSSFNRNKLKYVKCIPSEDIAGLIAAKERTVKQLKSDYQAQLHNFQAMENRLSITPQIKHFEGKKEVMRMYEEVLKGQSFDAIFNPQLVKEKMPEYHEQIPKIAQQEGVVLRELLVQGPAALEYKMAFETTNHTIRFLPKGVSLDADIIITKNEIYMVGYGERDVSATEIRNPVLAQAQRVLFEGWWSQQD